MGWWDSERLPTHVCVLGRPFSQGMASAQHVCPRQTLQLPFPSGSRIAGGAECRSLWIALAQESLHVAPEPIFLAVGAQGETELPRAPANSSWCLFAACCRRVQAAPSGKRRRAAGKQLLQPSPARHSLQRKAQRERCRYRLCLAAGTVLLQTVQSLCLCAQRSRAAPLVCLLFCISVSSFSFFPGSRGWLHTFSVSSCLPACHTHCQVLCDGSTAFWIPDSRGFGSPQAALLCLPRVADPGLASGPLVFLGQSSADRPAEARGRSADLKEGPWA